MMQPNPNAGGIPSPQQQQQQQQQRSPPPPPPQQPIYGMPYGQPQPPPPPPPGAMQPQQQQQPPYTSPPVGAPSAHPLPPPPGPPQMPLGNGQVYQNAPPHPPPHGQMPPQGPPPPHPPVQGLVNQMSNMHLGQAGTPPPPPPPAPYNQYGAMPPVQHQQQHPPQHPPAAMPPTSPPKGPGAPPVDNMANHSSGKRRPQRVYNFGTDGRPMAPSANPPPSNFPQTAGVPPPPPLSSQQHQQPLAPGQPPYNGMPSDTGMMQPPPPPPHQQHPGMAAGPRFQSQAGWSSAANPGANPNVARPRIDPNQIPSPIKLQTDDQAAYLSTPYGTGGRNGNPPLASTDFIAIDEGNSNPKFMRLSVNNIPTTEELANNSHLPLALVIQPLAKLRPEEAAIPLVDLGEEGPVRCTRCKGYINPFCTFTDGGRRFICSLCQFASDVPNSYFCNLDMAGRRMDLEMRPELMYGTCEYIPTKEYYNREAHPASFLFAIDVSWNSVQSGMLIQCVQAIKDALYGPGAQQWLLPGVRVGILTFDRNVNFYNLSAELEQAQMLVVSDIDDMFTPIKEGLLVDPIASKTVIESLLDTLPTMFQANRTADPVLGAALQAAHQAMEANGGRLLVFQTMLPIRGPGTIQTRDDNKLINTDKEYQLFTPQGTFYKDIAEKMVEAGVCVDLFLFPNAPMDLATIGIVSSTTGGDILFYPNFAAPKDGYRFQEDLKRLLQREFGFEGVMRIRCSDGLRVMEHFGNFHMRNATDVELAGIDTEKTFAVQLGHTSALDEKLNSVFQCALLYTRADGQRRIRVHNISVPSTSVIGNMFRHADMDTCVNYLLKAAMTEVMTTPLKNVGEQLTDKCVHVLAAYRKHCATATSPGQLILPESFKLFPLITVAILKTMAMRPCQGFTTDARIYTMRLLRSMSVPTSIAYLYPQIYVLHDLRPEVGVPDAYGRVQLPDMVRASYERLEPNGIYLLDNSQVMVLWIGRQVAADLLKQYFGVDTIEAIDSSMTTIPRVDSPLSHKLQAIATYLQSRRARHLALRVVRQQLDQSEMEFASLLVEDKNNDNLSYVDYLCQVHRQIQTEVSGT